MPMLTVVTEKGGEYKVEISPVVSLLNTILRNDIPISHSCGGHAQCGTCRVRIEAGADRLSPMKEDERKRLDAVGAPKGFRLACQTYAFGDVTVAIPASGS